MQLRGKVPLDSVPSTKNEIICVCDNEILETPEYEIVFL